MRGSKRRTVEDAGLCAIDEHAPERKLAHDLVQRALGNQPLLKHVAEAVESGAEQGEEVAFDGTGGTNVVCARDVVGAKDDA